MSIQFPHGPADEAAFIHQQGMSLWRAGRLDDALIYFNKALAIKEKFINLSAAASTIHMIGVIYAQKEDWDNATRYMLRSLQIDAEDRHNDSVAKSLNDIAKMCGDRGMSDAKSALVTLGNLIIGHFDGRTRLDESTTVQLCQKLPDNLRSGVQQSVKRLMGWP